jgi:signal recognition particle subunit SRP54
VKIAKQGIDQARRARDRVVIIDTAGRLQIDEEMMRELIKVKEAVHPDEILLVADGMTGQEAVRIAQGFDQALGVTGVILTKLDGDARGGAALSIYGVTKKPINTSTSTKRPTRSRSFIPTAWPAGFCRWATWCRSSRRRRPHSTTPKRRSSRRRCAKRAWT